MRKTGLVLFIFCHFLSIGCPDFDAKCKKNDDCVHGYLCNKNGDCVEAPLLSINTNSPLPKATVGVEYFAELSASGGILPYRWAIDSELDWLMVDEHTGNLSGIPTEAMSEEVNVSVTDGSYGEGTTANKELTLTVIKKVDIPEGSPVTITTSGGGTISTNRHKARIHIGGPQPFGVAKSSQKEARVGPRIKQ